MIFVARRKTVIIAIFSFLLALSTISQYRESTDVFSNSPTKRIIIDAGHGLPDGGAIGANGTIESTLNIKLAKMVEKLLVKKGYTVIMTRTDENTIADSGKTLGEKKKVDMHKRLEIINDANADMFVSIHMNKFEDSRYKGAFVLFSGNFVQSRTLAAAIQEKLVLIPENDSKRTFSKAPDSIFLLKNASIPAVIVECGFLSNFDEEMLLNTPSYQKKLAEAITDGIEKYYLQEGSNEK